MTPEVPAKGVARFNRRFGTLPSTGLGFIPFQLERPARLSDVESVFKGAICASVSDVTFVFTRGNTQSIDRNLKASWISTTAANNPFPTSVAGFGLSNTLPWAVQCSWVCACSHLRYTLGLFKKGGHDHDSSQALVVGHLRICSVRHNSFCRGSLEHFGTRESNKGQH